LMALLAITALAIPFFFLKQRMIGLRTSVAPVLGGAVIAVAVYQACANYSAITGVESVVINRLPYLLLAVAVFGAAQARWLRARKPRIYAQIGATRVDEMAPLAETATDVAPFASVSRREVM
jgi:hypothetical protein